PFLVGSSLDCIVAQRLARKLCTRCKEHYAPTGADLEAVGWDGEDDPPEMFRPIGCGACGRTGYHGRFAIHEVLLVSEDIDRKVLSRDALEEMLAREESEDVPLPRLLISSGLVGEKDLVAAVANQVGMRFVDLIDTQIAPEFDGLLPADLARSLLAVAVGAE